MYYTFEIRDIGIVVLIKIPTVLKWGHRKTFLNLLSQNKNTVQ